MTLQVVALGAMDARTADRLGVEPAGPDTGTAYAFLRGPVEAVRQIPLFQAVEVVPARCGATHPETGEVCAAIGSHEWHLRQGDGAIVVWTDDGRTWRGGGA